MKNNDVLRATRRVLAITATACAALALASPASAEPFRLSAPGFADGATLDASHAASLDACGTGG